MTNNTLNDGYEIEFHNVDIRDAMARDECPFAAEVWGKHKVAVRIPSISYGGVFDQDQLTAAQKDMTFSSRNAPCPVSLLQGLRQG